MITQPKKSFSYFISFQISVVIYFSFDFFNFHSQNKKTISVRGKVFQIVTRSRKFRRKAETDTASKSINTKSTFATITSANIIAAIININHIRFVRWWWRRCCWRRVTRLSRTTASSSSMILNELILFHHIRNK